MKESGFSLVEALIALVILSIAGLGLFQMQGWGSKIFSIQKSRMEQKRILHNEYQKLAALELLKGDTLYEIYFHPCAYDVEVYVMDSLDLELQGHLPEIEPQLFSRAKEFRMSLSPNPVKAKCPDTLSLYGAIHE